MREEQCVLGVLAALYIRARDQVTSGGSCEECFHFGLVTLGECPFSSIGKVHVVLGVGSVSWNKFVGWFWRLKCEFGSYRSWTRGTTKHPANIADTVDKKTEIRLLIWFLASNFHCVRLQFHSRDKRIRDSYTKNGKKRRHPKKFSWSWNRILRRHLTQWNPRQRKVSFYLRPFIFRCFLKVGSLVLLELDFYGIYFLNT